MSGYILYGGRYTRALLVEMVLAEGDIAFERREVDIVAGEHRSPEFLAVNPAGLVPALVVPEGAALYETPAINLTLAERHGLTHLAPRPEEPERGPFLSGLFYLTGELEPALKRYFYPQRYTPRAEDIPAVRDRSLHHVLERFGVIDRRLQDGGPYHLGERFSLVDLTAVYWAVCIGSAERLVPYPALTHCMDLVTARPKLRSMFDDLKAGITEYANMQARGTGVE